MFGVADTLQCLEMGAVEILIVWENLEVCLPASTACWQLRCAWPKIGATRNACTHVQTSRVTLRNSVSNEETTLMLSKEQEADASLYKDKESGAELEVIERMPLLEWLANNYKKFGCQLEFITNKSQACAAAG